MQKAFIFLFTSILTEVLCANILYIAPCSSPSHHIWNRALAYGLIERGHKVTMFSHDREESFPANYTQIILEDNYSQLHDDFDLSTIENTNFINHLHIVHKWTLAICKADLETRGAKILRDTSKARNFDLVIYDTTLGYCFYPIMDIVDKPVVAVTPFLLPLAMSTSLGNHIFPSHIPHYSTAYSLKMNLFQRTINFLYTHIDILHNKYVHIPQETEILKSFYGENVSSVEETERRITILLANINPVFNFPISLPPNIIPVGGLQATPPKPLPKDLQQILDESTNGVILFSLGSNLRSDSLSYNRKRALLKAFSRLSQTVLWKYESPIEGLPKNVIVREWLPQNDLLGHRNVKLLVTHGGALSTQEAMYHGVPIVGIPFFSDQFTNVFMMADRKLGVQMSSEDLEDPDAIVEAFQKGLNPKYRNNMQTLSRLYHDQPQTALDRAVFWVEHVLRHGGATHLNPVSRDMFGYQTRSLDVLGLLVSSVVFVIFIIYKLVTMLYRICKKRKQKLQ